jgi:ankyrin repeat protein
LLIEKHGDVNAQSNIFTPVHNALRYFDPRNGGDITVLTYLLSQKSVNDDTKDEDGDLSLHIACSNINKLPIEIFKFLIETHGFDVNVQDEINNTPIHYALGCFDPRNGGDITALTYLLTQTNLNVDIKDGSGETLFEIACDNINSLPLDVFKVLIETMGFDVNAQNDDNNTPLHRALAYFKPHNGDISVLQYLSNQMNTKGKSGDTLLHYACESINQLSLDVFKFLIEKHGADVNAQNNEKDTPLHSAFRCFDPNDSGDITVLTYLINQPKVHLNIKGKNGNTLLHIACEKIHDFPLEIFKLLIGTKGCDVNAQDDDNDTPLHNAFGPFCPNYDDHLVPVFMYLFSQTNIDVNIKGRNGHTILHLACICEIGYDDDDGDDDSDEGLEGSVIEDVQNQKADTNLCRIVEVIAERCVQQVLDETAL